MPFNKSGILLGGINAVRGAIDFQHIYRLTVLQRTKLFQLLGLFQGRWRPGGKIQQKLAAVRVNSQMQDNRAANDPPSPPADTESSNAKNKSPAPQPDDHLHQVRVGRICPAANAVAAVAIGSPPFSSRAISASTISGSISGSSPCTLTTISSDKCAAPLRRSGRSRSDGSPRSSPRACQRDASASAMRLSSVATMTSRTLDALPHLLDHMLHERHAGFARRESWLGIGWTRNGRE